MQNGRVKKSNSTGARVPISIAGRIRTGVGQGADFTRLTWFREQLLLHCGVDPFPGTLNLTLESARDHAAWRMLREREGLAVVAPSIDSCDATLYAIRISETVSGAIVLPKVAGYPADQIEIVAAVGLREHLGVTDGDLLAVAIQERHTPKAVIFDVDGTLLNSLDGYQLAASRATEEHGYTVSLDHVREALNTNQPFWDFIIPPGTPRDEELIAELRAATMRHWPAALDEVVDVIPGCPEALHRLREAGFRLAIYTGSGGESLPPLRASGLLELFEVIVTGNDVDARKPDPEGIRLCLDRLGIVPQDAAYIGDSRIDVEASHAAGVLAISVLTGAGDSASLSSAGTDRIVQSVAQLPELFSSVGH